MRLHINLLTLEATRHKPLDPCMIVDVTAEEVEDGRDEYDREVVVCIMVPNGTMLRLQLAPQTPIGKMN